MKTKVLLLLSAGLMFSAAVSANPLPEASSLENPLLGTGGPYFTAGLPATYGSYVLVDNMVSPYVGAFTGSVTSNVWRDVDDTLTFEYYFNNTTSGDVRDLVRATIGDPSQPWWGYTIEDAGSDASGSTSAGGGISWTDGDPAYLLRDPSVSGEGLTIQWRVQNDGTVIRNPGDYSALIWFDTDAINYQLTDIGILDSGLTADAQGFAPLSVIPEPASLALFGLLGLGLISRRRR